MKTRVGLKYFVHDNRISRYWYFIFFVEFTIRGKILVDFFKFQHNFRSPQVKRNKIIIHKRLINELPHKLPNNFTLKKLGHFKEISEILGIDGTATGRPPKREILTVVSQNCKKSAAKYSIEKPIPPNFVDPSTIPCQRLQLLAYIYRSLTPISALFLDCYFLCR